MNVILAILAYLVLSFVASVLIGRRLRAMNRDFEEFERFWREDER